MLTFLDFIMILILPQVFNMYKFMYTLWEDTMIIQILQMRNTGKSG